MLSLTQNTKALRGKSSSDTTTLLSEVNFDFAKSMNKIIFDKHMKDKNSELITSSLTLPPEATPKEKPYYGLINIPPHNFPEAFSQFSLSTLMGKEEVIKVMQIIRKECNDANLRNIYNINITHTMSVRDFEGSQNGSITSTTNYLKNQWGETIKKAIIENFQQIPGAPKTWFNLNEVSRDVYENGKLKKFLTQVKMIMQDTLLAITQRSVQQFVEQMLKFLPKSVKVLDSYRVENFFFTPEERESNDQLTDPFPLFQIELTTDLATGDPRYSSSPAEVSQVVQAIFDKGINNLKDIPSPEQKVLPYLFKSNVKTYLKATQRPLYKPEDPDPKDKKTLPDENAWIYVLYYDLTSKVDEAVEPLNAYMKTYSRYDKEYKLDPVAYIKKLDDDEENPPEIDFLKKDVLTHQKEAERLKGEIPDDIVVSIFRVSCREFRNRLVDKHLKIAKDEIDLIAKRAKIVANEILANFDKINIKIEGTPKDIEELTS
jgi:dynein heavy chain